MVAKYKKLEESIRRAGFFLTTPENMGGWDRIVVANRHSEKGLSGYSFWITKIDTTWYIGTWSGKYYLAPDYESLCDFVIKNLSDASAAATEFDAKTCAKFGISEIECTKFEKAIQFCDDDAIQGDLVRAKMAFKSNRNQFCKEEWYEGQLMCSRKCPNDQIELCFVFLNEKISIDHFDRITITPGRLSELAKMCENVKGTPKL